eukprot:COSAG04_NODE_19264_length_420_cov_1.264798_1_plen_77_part_10
MRSTALAGAYSLLVAAAAAEPPRLRVDFGAAGGQLEASVEALESGGPPGDTGAAAGGAGGAAAGGQLEASIEALEGA